MGAHLVRAGRRLLLVLLAPLRFFGRTFLAIWRYLGLLGLALRNLLTWLFWEPILFLAATIYRKLIKHPATFSWSKLHSLGSWLANELVRPMDRTLASWNTSFFSRVNGFISNIPFWIRRYSSKVASASTGLTSAAASRLTTSPFRLNRLLIAVIITIIIIALGVVPPQEPQPDESLAPNRALAEQRPSPPPPSPVPVTILVPTSAPTMTPIPTPLAAANAADVPPLELIVAENQVDLPEANTVVGVVGFSVRKDGNSDIYALVEGAGGPIRLTSHPAADRDPAWSPDGSRLAFSSRRDGNWEIYILDLGSAALSRITISPGFDGSPSWSPDGRWLVYESYQQDNLDLYIIDAAGENIPIRLTEHAAEDYSPSWASGGRHIAFTSRREGEPDIYILPLEAMTDDMALNLTNSPNRREDHPSFDSTGTFIAYEAAEAGLDLAYVQQLTDYVPEGEPILVRQGSYPIWSNNNADLLLIRRQEGFSFIVGGSVDAWNVNSQAYASEEWIDDLSWTETALPEELDLLKHAEANLPLFTESTSPIRQEGAPFLIYPVDVDAPSPYLSDRVDSSFEALRERTMEESGWDFLGRVDNMFTALSVRPAVGDSFENWNKTGRAFDFYHRFPLSFDPQVEIVLEEDGPNTFWRVFLRTANQDGSQGEPMRQKPWDFTARYGSDPSYYDLGGKIKDDIPKGYYVDFTALAADYDWLRTPALQNWRTFFQGIRYWHFENRQGLSWEEAILEIYTDDELARAIGSP